MSETAESKAPPMRYVIRRDYPDILDIEDDDEFGWEEDDLVSCQRRRNHIAVVLERGDEIIGFMAYHLNDRVIEILRLTVRRDLRRIGIGTQMVKRLTEKLSPGNRSSIKVHVRETNLAAQLFFRKQEFLAKRVVRKHYRDTGEDSYLMVRNLEQGETRGERGSPEE